MAEKVRGIKTWKTDDGNQFWDRPSCIVKDSPGIWFPLEEAKRLQRAKRLIVKLSNTRHPADMHEIWKPIDKLAGEWDKPKKKN
jgi:hypothetical protein